MARTATPVNFTLDLRGRPGPAASALARALIEAIAGGQLHDGDRLPSTRTLAASFPVARSAAVGAYEELTAAGFLVARPGGHTYVEDGAGAASRAGAFGVPLPPARRRPPPRAPDIIYDLRPGRGYFDLSPPGDVVVSPKGSTKFQPSASGKRYFLKVDPVQVARVREACIWLASQPK